MNITSTVWKVTGSTERRDLGTKMDHTLYLVADSFEDAVRLAPEALRAMRAKPEAAAARVTGITEQVLEHPVVILPILPVQPTPREPRP